MFVIFRKKQHKCLSYNENVCFFVNHELLKKVGSESFWKWARTRGSCEFQCLFAMNYTTPLLSPTYR